MDKIAIILTDSQGSLRY